MKLNAAIKNMTTKIADVLSLNDPSVYIYGSYVLDDFQYGWSDIDILVLTQKSISEQQANELVCLRQSITAAESDNPFYRCFEGGMLTLNAFIRKVPDRVVYWGTSGQRITDSYHFDACCMKELLDYSRLLHGKDIRGQLTPPSFEDIKQIYNFITIRFENMQAVPDEVSILLVGFWILPDAFTHFVPEKSFPKRLPESGHCKTVYSTTSPHLKPP